MAPVTEAPAPPAWPAQGATSTTVSYSSDAGHYVGGGRSQEFSFDNATFEPIVASNGAELLIVIRLKGSLTQWALRVITPNRAAPIGVGEYNTTGDPLMPALYFDFYGDGHGCNRATARLVIHAVEFTPDRLGLKNFRASFRDHHCEGASPAMQGEIAILADPWR